MMEMLITNASSYAANIDQLILLVTVLGGFWLFLSEGMLFYFFFKFSAKRNPKSMYITGEKKEEAKWIHIPHYLVLVCDLAVIIMAIWVWYIIKIDLPKADETIRIVGRQWSWTFVHPGQDQILGTQDDITLVDELHVKVDKTYHFKLQSLDVLHSFSVPVFRLKQDAIPGREITGWFKPTKTGTFDIQCAEMCGIGHGIMNSRIYIETEAEHNQWLKSQGQGAQG